MAERTQEEATWVQEAVVTLAEFSAKEPRVEFAAKTYTSPEPHLFVPSGVEGYEPRRIAMMWSLY